MSITLRMAKVFFISGTCMNYWLIPELEYKYKETIWGWLNMCCYQDGRWSDLPESTASAILMTENIEQIRWLEKTCTMNEFKLIN